MGALLRVAFVLALTFACLSSLHAASSLRKLAHPSADEIDASSVRVLIAAAAAADSSADSTNLDMGGFYASGGGEEEEMGAMMDDGMDDVRRELFWNDIKNKFKNFGDKVKNTANDVKNKVNNAANNVRNKVNAAANNARNKVNAASNNARNKVNAAANNARNKVNAAANDARNKVNAAGQKIGNGVKQGFGTVTNTVVRVGTDKDLQNKIITTARTAGEVAKTASEARKAFISGSGSEQPAVDVPMTD